MKQIVDSPLVVLATTTLAAVLIIGSMFWRQRKRQFEREVFEELKIPTKWKKVAEVEELILYPLKGGRRQCFTEAEFTKIGLREVLPENSKKLAMQDRVFCIYNERKDFVSLKRSIKVLNIKTSAVDELKVRFSFPGEEDLIVEIPGNNNNIDEITFYCGEKVKGVDCGDEAASWVSRVLQGKSEGLRLACFVQSLLPPRSTEGAYEKVKPVYPNMHSEYFGAFSDMASYMLMSNESVKDLNIRLEQPVSEHHFRPNIMVKGCPAFSEDKWNWVRIGNDVVLRGFKYCTRCVVTTFNPDTLVKDPAMQPLRTLKSYRLVKEPKLKEVEGDAPVMGRYLGCHVTGIVRVGDPVYIADE